jgi:hypothetical protein
MVLFWQGAKVVVVPSGLILPRAHSALKLGYCRLSHRHSNTGVRSQCWLSFESWWYRERAPAPNAVSGLAIHRNAAK